jgi:hypothetical protein
MHCFFFIFLKILKKGDNTAEVHHVYATYAYKLWSNKQQWSLSILNFLGTSFCVQDRQECRLYMLN